MKSTLINTRAFDMNNIDAINNKPIQIQCSTLIKVSTF